MKISSIIVMVDGMVVEKKKGRVVLKVELKGLPFLAQHPLLPDTGENPGEPATSCRIGFTNRNPKTEGFQPRLFH